MNAISTIDFGSYVGLKKILSSPAFDPKTITHLDFSRGNHTDTPPIRALKLLPFLKSIDFSHNSISRFNARNLVDGAPLLEELNFSHNNIKGTEDIVDLGGLKLLKKLTFIETPVVKKLLRIKLIEFLLRPSKYKPYTPIGLLTATYRHVSDEAKVNDQVMEERKAFFRILERDIDEIDKTEFDGIGTNKYHHRNTPLKLATIECPVPRKTRFPMLTDLNNEKISVQDIRQIFMTEHIQDIIHVQNNQMSSGKVNDIKEQLKGTSGKLYRRQLEGCRRQKARRLEEANKPSTIKDPENFRDDNSDEDEEEREELKHIMEMDKKEQHRLKKEKENYNSALWRHPKDLDVKHAEYNIGIAEHKKMIEDFKARKKAIKESKRMAKRDYIRKIREDYRARMRRKAEKAKPKKATKTNLDERPAIIKLNKGDGIERENKEEESWHSFGSDEELKKLFGHQIKKKKKANFELYNKYTPLDSSESSMTEHESDGEENLDAIQELLGIGSYRDPADDPMQKMAGLGDNEDGDKSKSISKATRTPIRETKEWKSTLKDFKSKLESIDSPQKLQRPGSYDSPYHGGDSSFDYKSIKVNSPHKIALLKQVESIEVVGSPIAGHAKNLPTRFLVAHESGPNLALPGFQSKPRTGIDSIIEVKEESKVESDFTEVSIDRKRLSRKSTKEYLAAKEKTDEAKRISMYSPFKKGMKEVEWENVIVQNELANLGELSAERKKQPMFIYQSHNDLQNDSSDEELFNFVTQGKNVELNKSKKGPEDSNQSIELQHQPSIDYPLSRFARYGSLQVKSPVHERITPMDGSCTPSSFDLEYINALHPQESKVGSRSEKISELSSKESRTDLDRKDETQELLASQYQKSLQGAKGQANDSNSHSFKVTNETANQSTERTTRLLLSGSKPLSRPSTAPWNIHISSASSHWNDLAAISEKARQTSQLDLNKSSDILGQVSSPNSTGLGQQPQQAGNKKNSHRKIGLGNQIKLSGSMNFQNVLELAIDLEKSKYTPKGSPNNQNEQKKPSKDFKIARKRSSIISQQLKIGPVKAQASINSTPKSLMTPSGNSPSDVHKAPKKSLQLLDPNVSISKAVPVNRQTKSLRTTTLVISPPSRNSFANNADIALAGSTRTHPTLYTIGETDSKREGGLDTKGLLVSNRLSKLSPSPPKIVVKESDVGPSVGSNSSTVLPRDKLCVEDLLPNEKDGVSEEMRLKILNGRVPGMYKRVLDTVERLNAFTKLIKESEELPIKLNLVPKKDELQFPKTDINFEQLAELLRQEQGVEKLEFKHYNDLRRLIYLVNDHTHEGELKLNRIEVEDKLRELKLKTLKADGKELEWLLSEIDELQRYWEIMENLHLAKDSNNDPKNIEKLEERELKQAEDKAILTAHGLKLKKYYGETYVNKCMGGGIKRTQSIDVKRQEKDRQNDANENMQKKKQFSQILSNEDKPIPSLKNISTVKMSFADEIRNIEEEKRKAPFADTKAGSWNRQGGTQPLWPGGVERYIPEQIVRIEEHMENIRIQKIGALYKEGSKPLTAEEKILKKVKNFNGEKIKKKELKVRVEKYVKEAGKTVDEFLANEYGENDKRHDKKHIFQELMNAYYPIKKNTSQWGAFGEN